MSYIFIQQMNKRWHVAAPFMTNGFYPEPVRHKIAKYPFHDEDIPPGCLWTGHETTILNNLRPFHPSSRP